MIYQGKRASPGYYTGRGRWLNKPSHLDQLGPGEIMLVKMTTPDWIECFDKIKRNGGAIVTTTGGLTCHAAVVCREYEIPCVVSLKEALELNGKMLRVDGAKGTVEVIE